MGGGDHGSRVVCFEGVDGIPSRIGERDVVHGERNKIWPLGRATRVTTSFCAYACTVMDALLTGFRISHGAKRRLGPNSEVIGTVRQKR